jgi:septal ring factor EnvC (AmiA/AmiB activator)
MNIPEFILEALPILRSLDERTKKLPVITDDVPQLKAKLAEAEGALATVTAAIKADKEASEAVVSKLKADNTKLTDELAASKKAEAEAVEKLANPSRQAAELLAKMGVKIADAPSADAKAAANAKPKSGFAACQDVFQEQLKNQGFVR